MGDTIKEIAKACQTLDGKDSSPTAGIVSANFLKLHIHINLLCILNVFNNCAS
jgi:hypothetical protein